MSFEQKGSESEPSQIVDLASFRKKKEIDHELARGGRRPLYVSHMTGKVTGQTPTASGQNEGQADFGDRLQRIRSSLEKINRLMSELKKMSTDSQPVSTPISSSGRNKL
jgi:hypothetical protein